MTYSAQKVFTLSTLTDHQYSVSYMITGAEAFVKQFRKNDLIYIKIADGKKQAV